MISVLFPVYNVERYLDDAITSILSQTFREFELLAVDDGSSDRTPAILMRYAKRDSRIRLFQTPHVGGAAAANFALNNARADWVAMMHGDDISLPTRLERQYAMTRTDPDVVIWGTDGYHINSTGRILSSFRVGPTSKHECREWRRRGDVVQSIHPTVLLNREVAIQAGGYREEMSPAEDIDLFDRMLCYGDLVTLPEPLVKYRIHSASLSMVKAARMAELRRYIIARQAHRSRTNNELTLKEFQIADRQRGLLDRLNDKIGLAAGICYRTGGMHYGEGNRLKSAMYLLGAFTLRPTGNARRLWSQVLSPRARRNMHASQEQHLDGAKPGVSPS